MMGFASLNPSYGVPARPLPVPARAIKRVPSVAKRSRRHATDLSAIYVGFAGICRGVMTTAEAVSSPVAAAGAVRFLGDEGGYWRLRIKGAALVVVTLGIYRFWLATDARRFLWSNTEIAGDTLEYNGLATELLIGF